MATVYSVQKTKWDQNVPSEKIDTTELAGRVRVTEAADEPTVAVSTKDIVFELPDPPYLVFHASINTSAHIEPTELVAAKTDSPLTPFIVVAVTDSDPTVSVRYVPDVVAVLAGLELVALAPAAASE